MELLNRSDLEKLSEPDRDGTHVSLFVPTHRFGDQVETDPLRWKNLLSGVETELASQGLDRAAITNLLAPAWELHRDTLAWQNMSGGLAFFIRPDWNACYRLEVEVPAIAMIGDRFVMSPLLPALTDDSQFLLLTVSQRRVRLLRGDHERLSEVELDNVPTDLREIMEPHDPRSNTMTRPVSPRGGQAVFFGHGAADDHFKKDQIQAFMQQVANGLQSYLADQHLPMVLVGLEEMLAFYRGVNQYAHLTSDEVRSNPDSLSAKQLHEAAWPLINRQLELKRDSEINRFDQLIGTGRASDAIAEIETAARDGRVEMLFVTADLWNVEGTPSTPPVVLLGSDTQFSDWETIDRAATESLMHDGRVYSVPANTMPGKTGIAAIFRY